MPPMSWRGLYAQLFNQKQFDIPDRKSTFIDDERTILRDVSLELGTAIELGTRSPARFLYCDVITSTDRTINLPPGRFNIITRVFLADCAEPQLTLVCREGPVSFCIYTLSFLPGTSITVKTRSSEQVCKPILCPDAGGIRLLIDARGKVTQQALTWSDANRVDSDAHLQKLVRTQFTVAAACLASEVTAPYAIDIINFILTITKTSIVTREVRMQALALHTHASLRVANVDGPTYVPRLDFSVFAKIVETNIVAAEAFEQEYSRYSDLEAGSKVWIEAAAIMKDHYCDLSSVYGTLVRQAHDRYDDAEKVHRENSQLFQDAKSLTSHAHDALQLGNIKWKEEQGKEAILAVFKALYRLLLAVHDNILGLPEAAEAVVVACKATQEAFQASQSATGAESVVYDGLKEIEELPIILEKMATIGREISTVYIGINKFISATTSPNAGTVDIPDGHGHISANFITALAAWDMYLDELEVSMKFPISAGISGSEEYRLAARKMTILGKALLRSKVATIRQGQELARALLQLRVNTVQQERLTHWITQLGKSNDAHIQAQVVLFDRLLDVRGWIHIYLQSYIESYRYWALASSIVKSPFLGSIKQFKKAYSTVATEAAQAYANFEPPPQPFRLAFNWGSAGSSLNNDILESLKHTKMASFTITPAHLPNYARVRVKTIRIFLLGVTGMYEDPVRLEITNDGTYLDRTIPKGNQKSQEISFYSSPLRRVFHYVGQTPVMDGEVAFPSKYFQPTPFTQWSVMVKSDFKSSSLTGVKLELIGDAIPF